MMALHIANAINDELQKRDIRHTIKTSISGHIYEYVMAYPLQPHARDFVHSSHHPLPLKGEARHGEIYGPYPPSDPR